MLFKPSELPLAEPKTIITQTLFINKALVYYSTLAYKIEFSIKTLNDTFNIDKEIIHNYLNDKEPIFRKNKLCYHYNHKAIKWWHPTNNKFYNFLTPDKIQNRTDIEDEDVLVEMLIACTELDSFFSSYIDAVFNYGRSILGDFKLYNDLMNPYIFEQKL